MMKLEPLHWKILIFNLLYIIPFTIYYILIGNFEFLIYILVLVVIGVIIFSTLEKTKFDDLALWGLSIWGLLHMAGGGIRIGGETLYSLKLINLYQGPGQFVLLKMDQVIHLYGFLVAALVIYQLVLPYFKNPKSKMPAFIAWIGSMGLGSVNEVVEFIAFISLAKTGVGDLYNTGLDLIFNLIGALIGAFIGYYWTKRKFSKGKSKNI